MIDLYSGTPGSGKSLAAAYELIRLLQRGRNVIANFPIDETYFKRGSRDTMKGQFLYLTNQELTVDSLKEFAKDNHIIGREGQTTVIIDECAAMFNSRAWDAKDRMQWIYFFQQHRKLGFNVILIAQHDRLLDRQIRAFIETEYKHRNIKNYKFFGFFLYFIFGGLFMQIEYWYGTRLKCSSNMFRLNKKKANIYNTYQIFETSDEHKRKNSGADK